MNSREMVVRVEALPGVLAAEARFGNQVEVAADFRMLVSLLTSLRSLGFEHLSNILAVDWINDGEFEIVYNLFSYRQRLHTTVKSRINRDRAHAPSIMSIWPQAQVYEREVHEFFGIVFDGNRDLGPFFLHNWHDIPPLRKDFDTEQYSREAYGMLADDATTVAALNGKGQLS